MMRGLFLIVFLNIGFLSYGATTFPTVDAQTEMWKRIYRGTEHIVDDVFATTEIPGLKEAFELTVQYATEFGGLTEETVLKARDDFGAPTMKNMIDFSIAIAALMDKAYLSSLPEEKKSQALPNRSFLDTLQKDRAPRNISVLFIKSGFFKVSRFLDAYFDEGCPLYLAALPVPQHLKGSPHGGLLKKSAEGVFVHDLSHTYLTFLYHAPVYKRFLRVIYEKRNEADQTALFWILHETVSIISESDFRSDDESISPHQRFLGNLISYYTPSEVSLEKIIYEMIWESLKIKAIEEKDRTLFDYHIQGDKLLQGEDLAAMIEIHEKLDPRNIKVSFVPVEGTELPTVLQGTIEIDLAHSDDINQDNWYFLKIFFPMLKSPNTAKTVDEFEALVREVMKARNVFVKNFLARNAEDILSPEEFKEMKKQLLEETERNERH